MSGEKPTSRPKGNMTRNRLLTGRGGRSGVTQLMVFLNGLILTITAFVTLSVFIGQMRDEDVNVMTSKARHTIETSYSDMVAKLETAARIIDLVPEGAEVASLLSAQHFFDAMAWYEPRQNGQWERHVLYGTMGAGVTASVLTSLNAQTPIAVRYTNVNGVPKSDIGEGIILQMHQMSVFRVIVKDGVIKRVIVGSAFPDNGLRNANLFKDETIQKLVMRDAQTGTRLLTFERNQTQAENKNSIFSIHTSNESWNSNFGNVSYDVTMEIRENMRMAFISNVPFLLLLFGLTLTMIGTLYVRNSHRQALRLSAMNNALTTKNLELKNQVDESGRLYEALQRSEREYRGVIDSVSDIIFETDGAGNILFVNATWEKVTGFSIPHSLGRDLFDMLHPAEHDQQRRGFMNLVRGQGGEYRSITRLQTADGKYRAIELAFSMVRTDNTRTTRVVGTITDVEERRRAERALAETEKKYRTIVENAAGGIYQVAADGRILSANPALARILGYANSQELVSTVPDIGTLYVDPRERLRYEQDLENFGFIRNHESTIKRSDGQTIWISENARSVKDDDGNLLFYEGAIEDITQRKQAERALKEAKLQSDLSSRAKSEFLANMSHELRTPLNAIIGFSEIIQAQAMGPVSQPAYVEYAGDINDSGKKLLNIINEILDISRIEAGGRTLNENLFDLHKTVSICAGLLGTRAETAHIKLINNISEAMPKIIGEEVAFKQIVMNLLSNAIKFTQAEGQIILTQDFEDVTGDLRLSITDTGIGMDDKEIEKALSPFGQVESAFARSNSGTGLGLTLVDALIKLHGGRFELVSRKGVGTTATIIIPAKRVSRPQPQMYGNELPTT